VNEDLEIKWKKEAVAHLRHYFSTLLEELRKTIRPAKTNYGQRF
jgi:hypothetical protein